MKIVPMTPEEVRKLRGGTVAEICEQLGAMNDDELRAVLADEQADDSPRKTLVAAIEAELAQRTVQPEAERNTANAGEGPPAAAPAWQAEDYLGPLTAEQAQWRLRAFGHHVTKPATPTATK